MDPPAHAEHGSAMLPGWRHWYAGRLRIFDVTPAKAGVQTLAHVETLFLSETQTL